MTILWFCVGDLAMLTFPISAIPLIFATRKLIASSIVETVSSMFPIWHRSLFGLVGTGRLQRSASQSIKLKLKLSISVI